MKSILVLLDNTFQNDRRVYREVVTLKEAGYNVTLLCLKGDSLPEHEVIEGVEVYRWFNGDVFDIKRFWCFNRYAKEIAARFEFDSIHANDHTMLHMACVIKKLKKKAVLVYDSHELFHAWPLNITADNRLSIRIKSAIVRLYQVKREKHNRKHIDYLITVNDSLANDLISYLKCKNNVCVLRNIPNYSPECSNTNLLRKRFGINDNTKILVFIGANIYAKTLNLEQVIDEFSNKEKYALVFICADNSNAAPLKQYVWNKKANNIYFHDIIKPVEIQSYLCSADVGLVPTWNKKDLSYWYALDNKLFEYINARIPVLATQQPEYKKIIKDNKCGLCVNPDEKDAYIKGLESLLSNYSYYKTNVQALANQLTWENEKQKLTDLYGKIMQ